MAVVETATATKPDVLLTFDKVHNPLRLPHETTSERPKVARTCSVSNILAWKCASRRNSVHFFDISTSQGAPSPSVFDAFDFEMCFAPERRPLIRHVNFQKVVREACFVHVDLQMCFAPQRRATFHLSSGQMAPHPPL